LSIDVREFDPIDPSDLMLAHDADYVKGVLDGSKPTGFGMASRAIAGSLLYTNGSMLAAARHACSGGARIVCSPTSGFHHAGWSSGGGYCTFNGLVVTALKLMGDGAADRVAILDLDMHYGNGTDDILKRLKTDRIAHHTAGRHFFKPEQARPFLDRLPSVIKDLCRGKIGPVDVVLYQAGADPHNDDPLGGWLTSAQLRERDALVFETCIGLGVPLAWNLAGGYQTDSAGGIAPVLAIHRATMEEAMRADEAS
jgi:acetoin utilization deacetylase AcuC-like enzyme